MPWIEDEQNGLHFERERRRSEGPRRPTLDELRKKNGTCPGHTVRVCICDGAEGCVFENLAADFTTFADVTIEEADERSDDPAADVPAGGGDDCERGALAEGAEPADDRGTSGPVRDAVPGAPRRRRRRGQRGPNPQAAPRQAP